MIFRHLFYCKHVERLICQVWRSNKVVKKFNKNDAQHYRSAFSLRQRMLHCVQNLEYHMMVEVIEPHWCTFLQNINKVMIKKSGLELFLNSVFRYKILMKYYSAIMIS